MNHLKLEEAAAAGDLRAIENVWDDSSDSGSAAIDAAAWAGQEAAVELLVELGGQGPANNYEGGNPLHYPSMTPRLVAALARSGCDLNGVNAESGTATPLTTALRRDDLAVARALLEAGADPSLEHVEVEGETFPIASSAEPTGAAWEAIQSIAGAKLLEEFDGRFGFSDPSAFEDADPMLTPLFVDALSMLSFRGQNDLALWIFERRLGVAEVRFGHYLALAIAGANHILVDRLLEAGAKVCAADLQQVMSALLRNMVDPKDTALRRLGAYGLELPEDLNGLTPRERERIRAAFRSEPTSLPEAIRDHDFKAYRRLIPSVPLNPPLTGPAYLKSSQVPTPLGLAVVAGADEIAADLVRRGAVAQSKRDKSAAIAAQKKMVLTLQAMKEMGFRTPD